MQEAAIDLLGPQRGLVIGHLADCGAVNLDWYLQGKIIEAEPLERSDHARVLKYALNFCLNAAVVTFIQESSEPGNRTPDLKIATERYSFYVEVKQFRGPGAGTGDPASKIVYAVTEGRTQLPSSDLGFVAIDNFNLDVEWDSEGGQTHEHIVEAFCELERLAAENPGS